MPTESTPTQNERPKLRLIGTDGNAFAVLGRAQRTLRKQGFPPEAINAFMDLATAGDYDHLLYVVQMWFDVT